MPEEFQDKDHSRVREVERREICRDDVLSTSVYVHGRYADGTTLNADRQAGRENALRSRYRVRPPKRYLQNNERASKNTSVPCKDLHGKAIDYVLNDADDARFVMFQLLCCMFDALLM